MTDSQKFDLILEKIGSIDGKIDTLKTEVGILKTDVAALKTEVGTLRTDVDSLKTRMSTLESDIKDIKLEITGIHLTLENEIRVNIIRVAEGHFDLSRKLDEYIQVSHEIKEKQEITDIYLKMHENKLRALA